jgi:Xaa-Pro aminopeptidase
VVGYPKGAPERAFYVAAHNERWHLEVQPVWLENVKLASPTSVAAAEMVATVIGESATRLRIAVEPSFMPSDAMAALSNSIPNAEFVDATPVLETLRSIKTSRELALIRAASEGIVDAMLATFATAEAGETKDALAGRFAAEVCIRGLTFDYALVSAGPSLNRAPFGGRLERGDLISLDSGGRLGGYIGDLCRMAVLGDPNGRMQEALDDVRRVQAGAFSAVRPGNSGAAIYEEAQKELTASRDPQYMRFVAHGVGLITHEAPRLTDRAGPPYPATHLHDPLEAGMVLSIETHVANPNLGFVKLEDTVIVTETGWESPGGRGRGWNRAGIAG